MVGATLFLGSCAQEMDDDSVNGASCVKVTITAAFPEEVDSKVAASDGETSLELSWEESDYLTVVSGGVAEKYTLKSISGKEAQFEGVPACLPPAGRSQPRATRPEQYDAPREHLGAWSPATGEQRPR